MEHTGFLFQPEPTEAAEMLKLHSGGRVSEALLMAMDKNSGAEGSEGPRCRPSKAAIKETYSASLSPQSASEQSVGRTARRRSKWDKDDGPIDLLPPPEKKNPFCCFI